VQRVVGRDSLAAAVAALGLPEDDRERFEALAREELRHLEPYNCALPALDGHRRAVDPGGTARHLSAFEDSPR
jgi:hypothetical protein